MGIERRLTESTLGVPGRRLWKEGELKKAFLYPTLQEL